MRHGAPDCPLCRIEAKIGSARIIKRAAISVANWTRLSKLKRDSLALACTAHGLALQIDARLCSSPGILEIVTGPAKKTGLMIGSN